MKSLLNKEIRKKRTVSEQCFKVHGRSIKPLAAWMFKHLKHSKGVKSAR
jgi:hypothetical protein